MKETTFLLCVFVLEKSGDFIRLLGLSALKRMAINVQGRGWGGMSQSTGNSPWVGVGFHDQKGGVRVTETVDSDEALSSLSAEPF